MSLNRSIPSLPLILFDEPTQGLDPAIGALIDELIIDLTKRTKATSIIVTHLMDSAFHVARLENHLVLLASDDVRQMFGSCALVESNLQS